MTIANLLTSVNHKPTLEMVRVGDVRIDPSYQRKLRDSHRDKIIAAFDWNLFFAIGVSRRTDGSLWVFDGQHRVEAVIAIYGTDELIPAIIVEGMTPEDEAFQFYAMQTTRYTVSAVDRFHAQLSRNEAVALHIQSIVEECGFRIGNDATGYRALSAIGIVEELYGRGGDGRLLRDVLMLAAEIWGYREHIPGVVLRELAKVYVAANSTKSKRFDRQRLVNAVRILPPNGWRRRASEQRKAIHALMADEFNHRLPEPSRIKFKTWVPIYEPARGAA